VLRATAERRGALNGERTIDRARAGGLFGAPAKHRWAPPYNRGVPSQARHSRDGAGQGPRSVGPRLVRAWDALDRDRRLAAIAALLLFVTMLLPWYQQNAVVSAAKTQPLVSRNLNAFAVFSFVEAAVLLVAVAVLLLLYKRADGRTFHLPGGDGTVVFAAGIWTALLLVLRLFDKPGIAHNGVAANIGIQWGIFFALGAAGLLAYAGSRMRGAQRPEPPLLRDPHDPRPARGTHPREPRPDEDATVITPRPAQATRPDRAARTADTPPASAQAQPPASAPERPRLPPPPAKPTQRTPIPASADQLSFDDSPAHGD
jgi:hypothetical protein